MSPEQQKVIDEFHRLFYELKRPWAGFYRGIPIVKFPTDLSVYQEILFETKPEFIIETGTYMGGSAHFLADHSEAFVYTIDNHPQSECPFHKRVEAIRGSSLEPELIQTLTEEVHGHRTMVILDSAHDYAHVLAELEAYASLVSSGCYLIVEDTDLAFVDPEGASGPAEALMTWLQKGQPFTQDRDREKFLLTANPGGFLRRA